MKGIEGLPLKYIAMIIVAAIVVAALIQVTGILTESVSSATETANRTLGTVLDESIGNIVDQNDTEGYGMP